MGIIKFLERLINVNRPHVKTKPARCTWTFGDDGWKIVSNPINGKSNLELYADNELIFSGRYGALAEIIKKHPFKNIDECN